MSVMLFDTSADAPAIEDILKEVALEGNLGAAIRSLGCAINASTESSELVCARDTLLKLAVAASLKARSHAPQMLPTPMQISKSPQSLVCTSLAGNELLRIPLANMPANMTAGSVKREIANDDGGDIGGVALFEDGHRMASHNIISDANAITANVLRTATVDTFWDAQVSLAGAYDAKENAGYSSDPVTRQITRTLQATLEIGPRRVLLKLQLKVVADVDGRNPPRFVQRSLRITGIDDGMVCGEMLPVLILPMRDDAFDSHGVQFQVLETMLANAGLAEVNQLGRDPAEWTAPDPRGGHATATGLFSAVLRLLRSRFRDPETDPLCFTDSEMAAAVTQSFTNFRARFVRPWAKVMAAPRQRNVSRRPSMQTKVAKKPAGAKASSLAKGSLKKKPAKK